MRVVVTGSEHTGGLAALRGLRAAGFEPWAAVTTRDAYGARSRSAAGVDVVPGPRTHPRDFATKLGALAERLEASAVLPGTEAALLATAEHRDAIPPGVAVGTPGPDIVRTATDKELLPRLAERAGLASPPTKLVRAGERPRLSFPAVVKPLRSELSDGRRLRRFEASVVEDHAELEAALRALPDGTALAQPHLPGPIVGVSGVAWEGRVVASIHQVGWRTWPPGCGIVCFAETVPAAPALEQGVDALMSELRWSGIFNLQLVRSAGEDHLIDVNPRLYHSLALAVAAGLNLPAIWAGLLLGSEPAVRDYASSRRFRSEEDLRAVVELARGGRMRDVWSAVMPRRRTVHAVFALRDPAPAASLAARSVKRSLELSDSALKREMAR